MAKSTAAGRGRTTDRKRDFEGFYADLFGDRWPALREALVAEGAYEELTEGLTKPYYLDPASAAAARLLPLPDAGRVLDACAAPGGKTLVLATRLPDAATLVANERSASRRARLHRVLDDHLPVERRERITVTGHDATRWGLYEQNAYEAILLDVPCSSERHLMSAPSRLRTWSPKRSSRLAIQAFAMVAAMIDALRPGGTLVYATCALTDRENDRVIEKALDRRGPLVELAQASLPGGETTRCGAQVLPDAANGSGPLYAAVLRKRPKGY
jgi:16S rRNA C967 or C1407 C5-methylase (RsmB/RsmF family)